jgi:hypothetical protein
VTRPTFIAVIAGAAVISQMAGMRSWPEATVFAQTPQVFEFFVSAADAAGKRVTDLRPEDVVMSENGVRQQVVKVERQAVPIKVTIAVDNSGDSADALSHYRSGLAAFVESLPPDVEVTVITTTPQPRAVLRSTSDRTQILRAINGFAPEPGRPRFTEALVEFSERLQKEARDRNIAPYVPVLIMLSTTAVEQNSYEAAEITKAANFLVLRRARVNVIVMSTRTGQATSPGTIDASMQGVIAMPIVKATNGRYQALAASSRLATLLPEWGRDLAVLHDRQINQVRVTVERARGGELQNPRIELARPGLDGIVTIDGHLP